MKYSGVQISRRKRYSEFKKSDIKICAQLVNSEWLIDMIYSALLSHILYPTLPQSLNYCGPGSVDDLVSCTHAV